ncbi:MAG TPA: helix-turn-helix transcriptional regulator [Thermoanaerobaculia bacterium]|jgi:transcriptional regulator with XRE-family HTH domain|nr:helix-turn-helix transcriptional regulator [Thermoanaerobaculia bacterium]
MFMARCCRRFVVVGSRPSVYVAGDNGGTQWIKPQSLGNIRQLREVRHWTQEELALAAGVDPRTVQRAEAGEKLGAASLKAIAAAFDTTIEDLSVLGTDRSDARGIPEEVHDHRRPAGDARMRPCRLLREHRGVSIRKDRRLH